MTGTDSLTETRRTIDAPVIDIHDLQVHYPVSDGLLKVIDIPRWSVAEGEHLAIFGPSGSGKSTLLHLLAGVLPPTKGIMRVCGETLSSMHEAQRDRFRAEHIGYIFQNLNLLQGYSALDNVLMGATFTGKRVERDQARALLEAVGLCHRLQHLPSELSLGEQQRVAIARTLVKSPRIVLADEPTGSLDPRNTVQVIDLLRSHCAALNGTLILVSHEENVIDRFERRVQFRDLNRAWIDDRSTP